VYVFCRWSNTVTILKQLWFFFFFLFQSVPHLKVNFNDGQKGIGETGSFGTDCVELKSRTVSSLPKTTIISKQGKMKNKRLRRGGGVHQKAVFWLGIMVLHKYLFHIKNLSVHIFVFTNFF